MKQADILLRAKNYLLQIDRNMDPLTGQWLPADSVLRDEAVHQRLYFAGKSLGWIIAHDNDVPRLPFAPDPVLRTKVKADTRCVSLQEMTELLSRACDVTTHKGLWPKTIPAYLENEGYLYQNTRQCTPKGQRVGLRSYMTQHGPAVKLEPAVQQLLIDHLDDLAELNQTLTEGSFGRKEYKKITIKEPQAVQANFRAVEALSRGLHPVTGRPLPEQDPATQERLKTCFRYVAQALKRSLELGYYSAKAPFTLTKAAWESIPVAEEGCSIMEFLQPVNAAVADLTGTQTLDRQTAVEALEELGAITNETTSTGRHKAIPTPAGEAMGLCYQMRIGTRGEPYQALILSPEVQRELIKWLERFVKD